MLLPPRLLLWPRIVENRPGKHVCVDDCGWEWVCSIEIGLAIKIPYCHVAHSTVTAKPNTGAPTFWGRSQLSRDLPGVGIFFPFSSKSPFSWEHAAMQVVVHGPQWFHFFHATAVNRSIIYYFRRANMNNRPDYIVQSRHWGLIGHTIVHHQCSWTWCSTSWFCINRPRLSSSISGDLS